MIFDITPEDIASLNDSQLRQLVSRLCEAELLRRDFSSSFVRAGGHQNARDGGIDVRVSLPKGYLIEGYVPRAATGFQVKCQDMPRKEILGEMRPGGRIRQSIKDLANQSGAYIIVSSRGSVSETALKNRLAAMKEAVRGLRAASRLKLDFYDRATIAAWVRTHESVVLWVREQIGRPIVGWRPFGAWAAGSVEDRYLVDDQLRIYRPREDAAQGTSALEGIHQIRNILRDSRGVVRLVGLSGVGKTRLVQALFEESVGENCLNPTLAIYADVAEPPSPPPVELVTRLVATRERAILVIDNCTPQLHSALNRACQVEGSLVSLITVEYDVREDQPEETSAFKLEPSSPQLIEDLLRKRLPDISQIDARTIAEFSGGNARIAISLARTLKTNGSVAALTSDALLRRLLFQGHEPDEGLFTAAQACSLLYSFQGDDAIDNQGELARLGRLVDMSALEMYRYTATLQSRDLVQQRGVWRAVLPHAIANRFAELALQNIPQQVIAAHILNADSPRMARSLSRRLGYLHASKDAQRIARTWLDEGGLLSEITTFDDDRRAMFQNIAPVVPDRVLVVLENASKTKPDVVGSYTATLRSLAYEPAQFERCTDVLADALSISAHNDTSSSAHRFSSLFQIHLSGTHASIEQRLKVVEKLLNSENSAKRSLGLAALKRTMQTEQFMGESDFGFGALPRDYGFWPKNNEEISHWYTETLKLVAKFATGPGELAEQVRSVLAACIPTLWTDLSAQNEIDRLCRSIAGREFWPEGWLAIRRTIWLEKGNGAGDSVSLSELERDLRPTDLIQQVRACVLFSSGHSLDPAYLVEEGDGASDAWDRAENHAKALGIAVAQDDKAFELLIPMLVSTAGRTWSFGCGLAQAAPHPAAVWGRLAEALGSLEGQERSAQLLGGFLHGLHASNSDLVADLLDQSLERTDIREFYPYLQSVQPLGPEDYVRVMRSLDVPEIPSYSYRALAYGRATKLLTARQLQGFVLKLANRPHGFDAALEVLHMHLYSMQNEHQPVPRELAEISLELFKMLSFVSADHHQDHRLSDLAWHCLHGEVGRVVTVQLCQRLRSACREHKAHAIHYDDLIASMFRLQPEASLDGFLEGTEDEIAWGEQILQGVRRHRRVIDSVPTQAILEWCDRSPERRYPGIAAVISCFETANETRRWTPLALSLLDRAPDPPLILRQFVSNFRPDGWSGSLAAILERNSTLLEQLVSRPDLAAAITQEKARVRAWIEDTRRREAISDRAMAERFE